MDILSHILPLLPLRGLVIFPGTVMNLDIARARSLNAVNVAMRHGKKYLLFPRLNQKQKSRRWIIFTKWA